MTKIFWHTITLLLFLCTQSSLAALHISGSIGNKTLTTEDSPYIVEGDIFIPSGQKTTIAEGCVFLFKPFTGISVKGSLEVLGTNEKRVIFTSFNNESYMPTSQQPAAPFDWNGISIERGCARAAFQNCNVSFSVFGIKSDIETVVINNCIFTQNGQYSFTINEKIIEVHDNNPVYHYVKEDEQARSMEHQQELKLQKRVKFDKTLTIVRKSSAIVLLAGGIGLGATGGYFINQASILAEKNGTEPSVPKQNENKREIAQNKDDAKSAFITGGICLPVAAGLWFIKFKKTPLSKKVPDVKVSGNWIDGDFQIISTWSF